jgi:thiol-disulfide isomerase/thioredoxin
MSRCVLLALFLGVAPCSALRRTPTDSLVIDEQACALDRAPKPDFHNALALALPDDASMSKFLAVAEKAEEAQKTPSPEARKEYKAAMEEYVGVSKTMKKAQGRLMGAMEAMLEVPAVDSKALTSLMDKKEKDLLVVFYAPWCPHCQTFVLHDGKGSPEDAPLEVFNRNVMASTANTTLSVVRYDVSADRNLPAGFDVKGIPAIYMAAADGKKTPFTGNRVDSATLVAFIKANSAKTKKVTLSKAQNTTVLF